MNNNQHNFDDTQNTDETQILNTSLEQYRYLNQLCAEERLWLDLVQSTPYTAPWRGKIVILLGAINVLNRSLKRKDCDFTWCNQRPKQLRAEERIKLYLVQSTS